MRVLRARADPGCDAGKSSRHAGRDPPHVVPLSGRRDECQHHKRHKQSCGQVNNAGWDGPLLNCVRDHRKKENGKPEAQEREEERL